MKKVLPICLKSPFQTYGNLAQPLSVLYANIEQTELYIMDRFIQLFFKSNMLTLHLNPYPLWEVFNSESVDYEDISNNIIEQIREEINKNNYIITFVDEFYTPSSSSYHICHFNHEHLIYGFDDENKSILVMFHNPKGHHATHSVPYEDFIKAYNSCTERSYAFFRLKCNEDYDILKEIEKKPYAKQLLTEYVSSNNSFHYAVVTNNNIFGLAIYEKLIQQLILDQRLDMRRFTLLLEHKKMMYIRINNYFHQEQLAEKYKEVVRLADNNKYLALYSREEKSNDKLQSIIESIIDNLNVMCESEKKILAEVLSKL